jgi:lysozyme
MEPSQACINLVKEFEGRFLQSYKCPAGVWTIGVGHTDGVKEGTTITQEQADAYLRADLQAASHAINQYVKVPLTQHQHDSITSFVFNVGAYAFFGSTLLRKLNGSDFDGAADELLRWNKSGKRVLNGLTRRRMAERTMFLGIDPYGP